jgi:GNAT superfamily N-acetyltransferase
MEIKIADSDADIISCFEVVSELRPHLKREDFVSTVRRLAENNFKLVYLADLYGKSEESLSSINSIHSIHSIKAVAGIRIAEWLHSGRYLEIEDLITTQADRSKAYGSALFDWLLDYAKAHQCQQLRLVSGVARESAHRFYERKGMQFEAKYFSINI